jgi:hypothetical protein
MDDKRLILIGNAEMKITRLPRPKLKNNAKTGVEEIRCNDVDEIHPAQEMWPVAGSCEYGNESPGATEGGIY